MKALFSCIVQCGHGWVVVYGPSTHHGIKSPEDTAVVERSYGSGVLGIVGFSTKK